jgi:predicted hydrocarbon binding protein
VLDRQRDEEGQELLSWSSLGDVAEGRPQLGALVPVEVYRLLKFTLRDVLLTEHDSAKVDDIYARAGRIAGQQLARNWLEIDQDIEDFLDELGEKLLELRIGIMGVEKLDRDTMSMVLTMAEDLDCSGLPASGETVCAFDEGLIAGALEEFTGDEFIVKELDCWANGSRICRFAVYQLT